MELPVAKKSILMLSDDAHAVRACADLDVDVTVVIGSNQKDWGEVVIPSGTRQIFVQDRSFNVESVLLRLYRAGLAPLTFDAVYTTDELAIVPTATLGAALGTSSTALPIDVAALFRDKSLQKSALRAAGIPTANYRVIEDLSELPDDYAMPFAPAVLKPVAGGATEDTSLISSDADLQAAAARSRQQHWGGRWLRTFILEEFVPGDEWHVDGVVFDGHLEFISVGGYRETCLTTVTGQKPLNTFLFDPVDDAAVYERVTPLAERCLQVLGLANGVFHMELFHDADSGSLTFGECAARRGGGLIEEMVAHKFGVSLATAAIECVLGTKPTIKPEVRAGVVGSAYLPYIPGTLVSHPSTDELMELAGVEFATIELPAGYVMKPGVDTTLKIGQVMISAESRDALFRRADEIVEWFCERAVVVPADASPAQLRAWQRKQAAAAV
jgi:biotin carboxylase